MGEQRTAEERRRYEERRSAEGKEKRSRNLSDE